MTPETLPGVSQGYYFPPARLGVRAMLKELTELVLAIAKLLNAAASFIRSIKKK